MVFEWATIGPYEGGRVTFVGEYRGYKIYYLTATGLHMYALVDPYGVELPILNMTFEGIKGWVDNNVELPVLVEEYRGYTIYREPGGTMRYYGVIDTTETGKWLTLELCRGGIDTILGPDLTAKTLYETYRDIQIFRYTVSQQFTFTYLEVEYTRPQIDHVITQIDELLGPAVGPDEYVTTYLGYAIWKRSLDNMYYIIVDGLPEGNFTSVSEARDYIVDVVGIDPSGPVIPPGPEPDFTPMTKDPARGTAISGPIETFLTSVGLTEDALDAVKGSGSDPEKAALFAKSVSQASVGAVALLGTIGVVAEVASLGQVETVASTINMVLEKTGIAGLMDELYRLPFMSALVTPARHHWNSVYTPELSGLSQITRELVREVITLDTYLEEAAMQGLSESRAMRVWDSHWRELGIRDTDDILHRGGMTEDEWEKYRVIQDYRPDPRPGFEKSDLDMSRVLRKTILGRVDVRRAYQYGKLERPDLIAMYLAQGYEEDAELQTDIQIRASVDGLQAAIRRNSGMIFRDQLKDARKDESGAVGSILRERDVELTVIMLRWRADEMEEIDLLLIPTEYRDRALALGPLTEEEALVMEADMRAKAEVAIAEVRVKARAREEEVETLYRAALVEVNTMIDPDDLWVLRYKLEAARVEVAEEFEIVPSEIVEETPEEPE